MIIVSDYDDLTAAACFLARLLGIGHIPDVDIRIEIVDGYIDGAVGMCHTEEYEEILIEISTESECVWVTLCHEMVHARQDLEDWSHFDEDEAEELEYPLRDALLHWQRRTTC